MARRITRTLGVARTSAPLRRWALLRPSEALLEATMSQPTDFLYFGAGSYPIAPEAARRLSVPYAIDFEDFHRGEQDTSAEGRFQSELTASVEADAVRDARFVSMGSPLISARYEECLGVSGVVLHNVFPLPSEAPAFELLRRPLKLYWFSQTIGPGRGIEHAIRGAGAAAIETELRLRGRIDGSYREGLESLARQVAPKLKLTIHAPNSSAGMIDACRPFRHRVVSRDGRHPEHARSLVQQSLYLHARGPRDDLLRYTGTARLSRCARRPPADLRARRYDGTCDDIKDVGCGSHLVAGRATRCLAMGEAPLAFGSTTTSAAPSYASSTSIFPRVARCA